MCGVRLPPKNMLLFALQVSQQEADVQDCVIVSLREFRGFIFSLVCTGSKTLYRREKNGVVSSPVVCARYFSVELAGEPATHPWYPRLFGKYQRDSINFN